MLENWKFINSRKFAFSKFWKIRIINIMTNFSSEMLIFSINFLQLYNL